MFETAANSTLHIWFALIVAVVAVALYITEWVSLELTSLGLLTVLLVFFHLFPLTGPDGTEILTSEMLVAGFANPALLTVLAMLVVGEGLLRTGALEGVAQAVTHVELPPILAVALALFLVAVLSAFLNNTPIVVIFIPILQALALRLRLQPSRVMIPLSYVAIIGGSVTLIGSSTNLLVSAALKDQGLPGFGFFEFSPIALMLAAVTFTFVLVIAPRLLPDRRSPIYEEGAGGRQFVSQIVIPEDSELVGQTARAGRFEGLPDATVRMILREEEALFAPFEGIALQPGDTLVVAATRKALTQIATMHPGILHPPASGRDESRERIKETTQKSEDEEGNEMILAEAMVRPSSRMVGFNLEQYGFRRRTGCIVIGIQRRARMIRAKMTEIRLEPGDTLLIEGRSQDIANLPRERELVVMSGTEAVLPKRRHALTATGIFVVAVGLAAIGLVPILVAGIAAATLMLAAGVLNFRQAARSLDRRIVLVVVAALALGAALERSGAAALIAEQVLAALRDLGPAGILSGYFLLVALFTNILTNNACAVLFTPIGINLANQLGIEPSVFAIATVLAANCSFASPIGYQTNLLVMGPGNYLVRDFARAGLPLMLVAWLAFSLIAPIYWDL